MRTWPWRILFSLTVLAAVWLLLETRRLAELAGEFERRALVAERRPLAASLPVAEPTPEALAGEKAVDLDAFARLQLELHGTRQQLEAVTRLLEQRNAEVAAAAAADLERAKRLLQPIPAGVRLCLQALHECLRDEGFLQQRFLRAESLDDDGLHGVEMLETEPDGLSVTIVEAGRMTATLDRAAAVLSLRFFDGMVRQDGRSVELPEHGLVRRFPEIDGRRLEQRLPFLVHAEGAYPEAVAGEVREPELDPQLRMQWLRRLERVLAAAATPEAWRPTRLRGLEQTVFLDLDLVATDERGMLVATAHCKRAAIEVDATRGVVSLWMADGVLRRQGAESTISAQGYRMLLQDLTPKQATDAMFGMVVTR